MQIKWRAIFTVLSLFFFLGEKVGHCQKPTTDSIKRKTALVDDLRDQMHSQKPLFREYMKATQSAVLSESDTSWQLAAVNISSQSGKIALAAFHVYGSLDMTLYLNKVFINNGYDLTHYINYKVWVDSAKAGKARKDAHLHFSAGIWYYFIILQQKINGKDWTACDPERSTLQYTDLQCDLVDAFVSNDSIKERKASDALDHAATVLANCMVENAGY